LTTIKEEKKDLRKRLLDKRRKLAENEVRNFSTRIIQTLINSSIYLDAGNIMLYTPFPDEPQIMPVFEDAWSRNKQVGIPHLTETWGIMEAALIESFNDLVPGKFNLLVPDPLKLRIIEADSIDLIVVPGIAFDHEGYRLGMGAGYYDRFLPTAEKAITVGVCWAENIFSEIPKERHDLPMDYLLTEMGILNCKKGKM
jgi:5-formyltetrahydrofolate cyclo-ligase